MRPNEVDIRNRVPADHKENVGIGYLEGREVVVEKLTCWQRFTNAIMNLWPKQPAPRHSAYATVYENYRNMQLNPDSIASLTENCMQKLQTSSTNSSKIIRDWVVQVYSAHDINLSEDRGYHFMEVETLQCADALLNPVLLKELEKLILYSDEVRSLHTKAIMQGKPLSELVFQ